MLMHAYILQLEFCGKSFSHLRLFVEKVGKKYKSFEDKKLMIILRVICPLKMHFSLKVIPQYLKTVALAASSHNKRGLGPSRPPEAVG